ncbi:unnamed protein product [Cunninghamella blakesleeana]
MSTEPVNTTTNTIGENLGSTTQAPIETTLQPVVPETLAEVADNQPTDITTEEPSTVADTTTAGDTNVTTTSEAETPKAPEEEKAPSPTGANQKPALFSNIPNFLKKPFEKKHDDAAAPATTETTEEHATDNVPSEQPHHDKSENRLSRTILDLLHKKPAAKSDEGAAKDESTTPAAVNETTTEGNATTPAAEPSSPKEPFIDHLRRLFTPKKSTENTTETTDNTTPTDNAPETNTVEPVNAPVESSNVNEATPKNEEPKASLTRRISTIAQHWSSKLKENNKKHKATPEATTATNETEPVATNETAEVTETAPESHPANEPTTEPRPTTTEAPLTSSAPPVQASA